MSYASIGGATSFMIDEEKKGLKPEINHGDNSMNIDSHIENTETFENVASSNTITS